MVTVPDMVAAKHWLKVMRAEQYQDIDNVKYQIFQPTLEINPRYKSLCHEDLAYFLVKTMLLLLISTSHHVCTKFTLNLKLKI